MEKNIIRKLLVILTIIFFVESSITPIIKGVFDNNIFNTDNSDLASKINTFNDSQKDIPLLVQKNVLKENDEGPHKNRIFKTKEWWYYNVYLNDENSELKNWFVVISFQSYQGYGIGALKLELYDDENKSYGGDCFMYLDDIAVSGPSVNFYFNNSSATGRYPNWHLFAEYIKPDETEIIADLTFTANSLPVWLTKNTGKNRTNSLFGYYCILNCSATGNILFNGTNYNVSGLGYHDHTWAPMESVKNDTRQNIKNLKKDKSFELLDLWEWLCIHFDNGWDMFVGKIYSEKRYLFSKYGPGDMCFTTNGVNFHEIFFFLIEYIETTNSSIPGVNIPVKVHIKTFFFRKLELTHSRRLFVLDLYFEAKNTKEHIYGNPPSGYWVSVGVINGSVKSRGIDIELNGWAVMETTGR
jgi:predicted secreted hydrolase